MSLWLMKSEPDAWSWSDQVAKGTEAWTGVRNHQAAGYLKAMRVGDRAFFYHSTTGREIVGIVRVTREAYPDPTDASGRFVCVDVTAGRAFPRPVPLAVIKADPAFSDFALLRQARLSVMPVAPDHWQALCRLGGLADGDGTP